MSGAGPGYVGRSVPRVEDRRMLTGRARFVADIRLDGQLHAAILRSPVAHARLGAIDVSAALAMEGVVAVFTAADIAERERKIPIRLAPLPGFERFLQEPLARGKVRYVGEPVALVVADGEHRAEDAREAVAVDYDSLDAVVDFESAGSDEVIIHESAGTNLATRYAVGRGDADRAFATADRIVTRAFRCHRHCAAPLETRGVVAVYDPACDRLRVYGATKVPFFNRRLLADFMAMAEDRVEMIEVDVGGGFGVRGEFYPEDFLIPFAARRLGRPVAWIEDRREHLMATNHSREVDCSLSIALRRDGRILGMRATVRGDMGAYTRTNGGVVPSKAAQFLPGPYRIDDFSCAVEAYITNKTPVGTYRGPGRFECNFFRERLLDIAATQLGLDRAELRRRNLLGPDDLPYDIGELVPGEAGAAYDNGDYPALFERLLEAIGYDRTRGEGGRRDDGRYFGTGFACFVESSGAGPAETARIAVHSRDAIDLFTGCTSMGQGLETTLAQIGADHLDLPIEGITVHHGSTTLVDMGWGTYNSRAMVMGGSAVKLAADGIVAEILSLAGRRLNLDAERLTYRGGVVYRKGEEGEPVIELDELLAFARETGGIKPGEAALEASATFEQSERTFSYGAHGARVAVDVETGAVELLDYVTIEDVGRVVNPRLVHGQAVGAAVQGLGGTFLDELVYDQDGQLVTGTFADYLVPTSTDFPRVESITVDGAPSKLNPLGVKGAGEGGIVAVAAAAANAVADALAEFRVEVTELPISPANVHRWLDAAGTAKRGGG